MSILVDNSINKWVSKWKRFFEVVVFLPSGLNITEIKFFSAQSLELEVFLMGF